MPYDFGMLRIPRSKIYRAFPELDPFSDEDCAHFMQRARSQGGFDGWVSLALYGSAAVILIVLFSLIAVMFGRLTGLFRPQLAKADAEYLAIAAILFLVGALPTFGGLITRDIVYRRLMRRAINLQLDRIRCLECRYSLLGQIAHDGFVRCPECGVVVSLRRLGLSADDLIPPKNLREEVGLE